MRVMVALVLLVLGGWMLAGCQASEAGYAKPSIAVLKFENRASFPERWDLGGGTKDVLVDRLMKTDRYHVIERPEIDAIMRELNLQNSGATRTQTRAKLGQLKNVEYLIKGTITDFGVVGGGSLRGSKGSTGLFGGGTVAVMSMIVYVIQVESGEIVASERIEESVGSAAVDVHAAYKDMSFGGTIFAKTPLGKATSRAIDRAVGKISEVIAARPWNPRIAALEADGTIILNGGKDRGIREGQVFDVLAEGTAIVDPETGDTIGHQPGKVLGQVRVCKVEPRYSVGMPESVMQGTWVVGQPCAKPR